MRISRHLPLLAAAGLLAGCAALSDGPGRESSAAPEPAPPAYAAGPAGGQWSAWTPDWNDAPGTPHVSMAEETRILAAKSGAPASAAGAAPATAVPEGLRPKATPTQELQRVKVFPNPFRPTTDHTTMRFTQLPPGAEIYIFTYTGSLVRPLVADSTGVAVWDGKNTRGFPAAGGVYLVVLRSDIYKRIIKIAIER